MVEFRSQMQQENTKDTIILYGHNECPMVSRTRGLLERSGIAFNYVDIRANETGRVYVRQINHGNESVPTLLFPDGATLTEPSSQTLCNKLKSIGYKCQLPRWRVILTKMSSKWSPFRFFLCYVIVIAL